MDNQQNHNELITKDLYEASFFLAKDQRLIRLDKEGRIYWFVFSNPGGACERLRNLYWSGEGLVSARIYTNSIQTLKDRIFAQK